MVADYQRSKEIAAELKISHHTVQNHQANIRRKLNLRGPYALLKYALRHKTEF